MLGQSSVKLCEKIGNMECAVGRYIPRYECKRKSAEIQKFSQESENKCFLPAHSFLFYSSVEKLPTSSTVNFGPFREIPEEIILKVFLRLLHGATIYTYVPIPSM